MSLHSSFHRFITSSDYSTTAAGASSVQLVATSDYGSLLMPMDSDHAYHVTALYLNTSPTAKLTEAHLVSLDSDGAAGVATPLSKSIYHSYTVNVTPSEVSTMFNPPIRVNHGTGANFMSVRIETTDSDTVPGIAYSGFTTVA